MERINNMEEFKDAAYADRGVAVIEGTTKRCGNCANIKPVVDKLMAQYPDARFYTYDIDDAGHVAKELGANVAPIFHVFKNGNLDGSVSGAHAEKLRQAVREAHGEA